MVMISGYKSPLYIKALEGWNTYSFEAGCHHGTGVEYIWMNYPSPVELHDYRYLGDTFRQRERLKKITGNMLRRFRTMPVLERRALLGAINKQFMSNRLDPERSGVNLHRQGNGEESF